MVDLLIFVLSIVSLNVYHLPRCVSFNSILLRKLCRPTAWHHNSLLVLSSYIFVFLFCFFFFSENLSHGINSIRWGYFYPTVAIAIISAYVLLQFQWSDVVACKVFTCLLFFILRANTSNPEGNNWIYFAGEKTPNIYGRFFFSCFLDRKIWIILTVNILKFGKKIIW